MRLVIHSQGAADAGLRRFNGRGIFCTIGRKLSSFEFKKAINAGEKKKYPQKLIDTVVNGHPKKSSEKTIKKKGVKRKLSPAPPKKSSEKTIKIKGVKRKLPPPLPAVISSPSTKVRKYSAHTADRLINSGSGIVLD